MRDKQSITVACIYRFLKKGKINKARAIELMVQRAVINRPENTVNIWCKSLERSY